MKEVDLLIVDPTHKADWSDGCQRAQQQKPVLKVQCLGFKLGF